MLKGGHCCNSRIIETNDINKIKWCADDNQLANCMTKQGASGYQPLNVLQYGKMPSEF